MRVIKFRGKRIFDGTTDNLNEWVYGDLVKVMSDTYIFSNNGIARIKVHPETVGQFTGQKDKNGVEIYEGDIIKTLAGIIGGVKFICGCFCIYEVNTNNYHLLYIFECKVVGNIHENPELLEPQK